MSDFFSAEHKNVIYNRANDTNANIHKQQLFLAHNHMKMGKVSITIPLDL